MHTKEEAEPHEDRPSSPILRQISDGLLKVVGEVSNTMYSVDAADGGMDGGGGGGSGRSSEPEKRPSLLHRRAQSELITQGIQRVDSFQKLKAHVHKALRWGNKSREPESPSSPSHLCLEVMANQKRQWYQLHPKTMDCENYKEPNLLFEHFVIVGLHPDAKLDAVEHAFARRKRWQIENEKYECEDYEAPKRDSTLEPQLLFNYPPGKQLTVPLKELCSFCFPEGVKVCLKAICISLDLSNATFQIVYYSFPLFAFGATKLILLSPRVLLPR
ncbi:hypothetical protein PIB30_042351 [Stylosanthes scabra]|uniref:Uncharacterized protein n=1 Tax=Stylosanthes scabra TaxID=79078 RepID=A0ABU6TEU9_9FABA|nr:hypothetical protein [Stylosanthes scabra]